jgi:hypothetical protein
METSSPTILLGCIHMGLLLLGLNKSHPGPWPGTQPPKHEASGRRSAFDWNNLAIIMSRRCSMLPTCCWLIPFVGLSLCPSFRCWYFLDNLYALLWLLNILMYALCDFFLFLLLLSTFIDFAFENLLFALYL